jgi:hypothetical protein
MIIAILSHRNGGRRGQPHFAGRDESSCGRSSHHGWDGPKRVIVCREHSCVPGEFFVSFVSFCSDRRPTRISLEHKTAKPTKKPVGIRLAIASSGCSCVRTFLMPFATGAPPRERNSLHRNARSENARMTSDFHQPTLTPPARFFVNPSLGVKKRESRPPPIEFPKNFDRLWELPLELIEYLLERFRVRILARLRLPA